MGIRCQVWECRDRLHWKLKYVTQRGVGMEWRQRTVFVFTFLLQIRADVFWRAGRVSVYWGYLQCTKQTGQLPLCIRNTHSKKSLLCVWQCVHRMQESMCEKIDRSCNVFIKIQNVLKKNNMYSWNTTHLTFVLVLFSTRQSAAAGCISTVQEYIWMNVNSFYSAYQQQLMCSKWVCEQLFKATVCQCPWYTLELQLWDQSTNVSY